MIDGRQSQCGVDERRQCGKAQPEEKVPREHAIQQASMRPYVHAKVGEDAHNTRAGEHDAYEQVIASSELALV